MSFFYLSHDGTFKISEKRNFYKPMVVAFQMGHKRVKTNKHCFFVSCQSVDKMLPKYLWQANSEKRLNAALITRQNL